MSMLRKMKKEVAKRNKAVLPSEIYNNVIGSFLVTMRILKAYNVSNKELKTAYFKYKKAAENGELNDKTWLKDIAKELDIKLPYGDFALVVSQYNMLVAPYLDLGNEGGKEILPVRPDGFMGVTLATGRIYPIVYRKEVDFDEDGNIDSLKKE